MSEPCLSARDDVLYHWHKVEFDYPPIERNDRESVDLVPRSRFYAALVNGGGCSVISPKYNRMKQ
jgi:hypothetical protein